MALIKSIEYKDTGVFCSYWKVVETDIDWHNKEFRIVVYGYKDRQAREDGKLSIDTRVFDELNSFPFTEDGNNIAQAYEFIKTTDEFSDAEDDL